MGPKQSKATDGKTRYAVLGSVGSGQSSFINAIRRLKDDDEFAAKVGVSETTEYDDLTNPLVTFCDLPGYDPQNVNDIETYWNRFGLENCDRFLIITSGNLTDFDVALCEKVKAINKPFFIIRNERENSNFDEERELEKIKSSFMERIKHLRCKKENVFLINHRQQDKGDFMRLHQAIYNLPAVSGMCAEDLKDQYMSDAKEYIERHGISGIGIFLKEKFRQCKNVKIKFAIVGNAGTGKSAFINAIRGLKDKDEGAAKVDVVEVHIEPTEYLYPDNHLISFWDLPGFGGPDLPDFDKYCEKVGLTTYDVFLIFTTARFTKNDLKFAETVRSIEKSFFLIRTKIDVDCMSKKGKAPINEEEILQRIRADIMENVKNLVSSEEDIFLIGNYDKDKWDFDRLIKAIRDALPMAQGGCLAVSLRNITRDCLTRKAEFLKVLAVGVKAVSFLVQPAPGLSPLIDTAMARVSINFFSKVFGFDRITQEELNSLEDERIKRLIRMYQSPGLLDLRAMMSSLFKTIGTMEEVALAVWDNAAKLSNQNDLRASTND